MTEKNPRQPSDKNQSPTGGKEYPPSGADRGLREAWPMTTIYHASYYANELNIRWRKGYQRVMLIGDGSFEKKECEMKMMKLWFVVGLVIVMAGGLIGCTKNYTPIRREETGRPRVEQIAFSAALESAYKKADMSFCTGKKVFVETKALAKQDIEYINSYVRKLIIAKGGYIALDEKDAEVKMINFLEVTGTDEVTRTFGKDLVVAQVRGNFSITYTNTGITTKIVDLKGSAQTKRNKNADTRIIE